MIRCHRLLVSVVCCLAAATVVYAQRGTGDSQGLARSGAKPEVKTIQGKITAIESGPCKHTTGRAQIGTHLHVTSKDGDDLNIHLGPTEDIEELIAPLKKGGEVAIAAFRTDKLPRGQFIAKSISVDGQEIVLRGDTLRPVWAGPGGGQGREQAAGGQGNRRGPGWQGGRNQGQGQGRGRQWRGGRGPGGQGQGRGGYGQGRGGQWNDPAFRKDQELFHTLLTNRQSITRKVTNTEKGIETVTESDDPEIAKAIQKHVLAMKARVEEGRPIHMRDPLFAALFGNADKIEMSVEKTDGGVRVVETSDDPYTAKLIQAHARVVSLFIKNGQAEVRSNHEVPKQ
jgi:hypothetical protein